MESGWIEWANVLFRFVHVLAGIMWIGNSLLFTWMELNLLQPQTDPKTGKPKDPDLLGFLDMLHGGGVFHLQKRQMHADSIPTTLHWFKWQSYTTWITGFLLLAALFYSNGSSLVDATRSSLTPVGAVGLSLLGLFGGWLVYDAVWRSPLGKNTAVATAFSLILLFAATYFYGQVFNGRALFLQIGAMMGTWMSANVLIHIMGNQHKFMRSLRQGKPYDPAYGKRAKSRSLHNHYMTFPVLFLMLSAHFPSLHAAEWNVPILAVSVLALMTVKYLMNTRYWFRGWLPAIFGTVAVATLLIGILLHLPPLRGLSATGVPMDPLVAEGKKQFQTLGCGACHMQGSAQLAPTLYGIFGHTQELADGSTVTVDDTYLRTSILQPQTHVVKGYAAAMPVYGPMMNDNQVTVLIAYIKSLTPTK